jgi:hypothetical protein
MLHQGIYVPDADETRVEDVKSPVVHTTINNKST